MKKKTCKNCRKLFNPDEEIYPASDVYFDLKDIATCGDCTELILAAINGEVETKFFVNIVDAHNGETLESVKGFRSRRHAQEYGMGRISEMKSYSPFRNPLTCHVGAYNCG